MASAVSGAYSRLSSSASVTTVPGSSPALQGQVAAEPVDQRLGQAGHQVSARKNTSIAIADRHADVVDPRRPRAELGRLVGGPTEQLDERGAGRREPLRHLRRHRRVVVRRLALQPPDAGADAAGRDHERRQEHQRQQRDLPRQAEHHGERQHEGDDVGDDTGQRRRERPLGADDVVVQAADQRAGAGPGEEGDGHPLDVLEDLAAQVEDQAFAEAVTTAGARAGRRPVSRNATTAISDGDADHRRRTVSVDDGVDGPPGQHRRQHAERGRTPWPTRGT